MTYRILLVQRTKRSVLLVISLLTLIAGLSLTSPSGANATESPSPETTALSVSTEQVDRLAGVLKSSSLPRSVDGSGITTYAFENGMRLSYDESPLKGRLGGGKEKNGQFFISFNQLDQDFLMAGMGIGLTVAICSVPVVGAIACGVAGAIVTLAMVVIAHNGKCKNNKQLIVHVKPSWSTCR